MKKILLGIAAAAMLLVPTLAVAAEGYSTANVNMRSGPSTRYPAVTVIPVETELEIHGCLADVPWCDVSFYQGRGWVAAQYIATEYRQNRVYLQPRYYQPLGIPTITFDLGNYWERNYRNRDFYRERERWGRSDYNGNRRERRERRRTTDQYNNDYNQNDGYNQDYNNDDGYGQNRDRRNRRDRDRRRVIEENTIDQFENDNNDNDNRRRRREENRREENRQQDENLQQDENRRRDENRPRDESRQREENRQQDDGQEKPRQERRRGNNDNQGDTPLNCARGDAECALRKSN